MNQTQTARLTTQAFDLNRVDGVRVNPDRDLVTVEEPLEIRLGQQPLVVTMRTPGHDLELAAGFLWTERIIRQADDLATIEHCPDQSNVVIVNLADGVVFDADRLKRNFYASSSCGLCGKTSLDAVETIAEALHDDTRFSAELIHSLPVRMRVAQGSFAQTGGCHAAALFDRDGALLCLREDVGRHNAVDKVIGWGVMSERMPLAATVLMISGRAGFEIIQKAVMGGIPAVVAVGAPSSLAIETARRFRQTLVGFCRDGRFNIYHDEGRIR